MIKNCTTCLYNSILHNMKRCFSCKKHSNWISKQILKERIKCTCLILPQNILICFNCKKFLK